jgi:hypothetical protein
MKQTWIPVNYLRCQLSINQLHVNFICTWTFKCLISVRKLHALRFILCYEFNSVHVSLLILDLFCNYCHTQCVCNHSAEIVVISLYLSFFIFLPFWHIQNFIVNLDTKFDYKHTHTYTLLFLMRSCLFLNVHVLQKELWWRTSTFLVLQIPPQRDWKAEFLRISMYLFLICWNAFPHLVSLT